MEQTIRQIPHPGVVRKSKQDSMGLKVKRVVRRERKGRNKGRSGEEGRENDVEYV